MLNFQAVTRARYLVLKNDVRVIFLFFLFFPLRERERERGVGGGGVRDVKEGKRIWGGGHMRPITHSVFKLADFFFFKAYDESPSTLNESLQEETRVIE